MKKRRACKIILVTTAMLLVAVLVAGFVAGNYLYNLALNPHYDRSSVFEAEHNEVAYDESYEAAYSESRRWFEESGYVNLAVHSNDGLKLNGYLLENPNANGNWAVLCHGYASNSWTILDFARNFYNMGYSLLLPDARGCGWSEGDYIGMGWHDRLDVLDWLEMLNRDYAPRNIVLYGVSMGGATVMMAAGEELPENVRAIVEDCGYTSVREEFAYQAKALFGAPAFPLLEFTSAVTRVRAGFWLGEADALKQVAKSTTPILFIHGEDDAFVPARMAVEAYEAATCEKELYVVPGGGHGLAYVAAGDEYWQRVAGFCRKYLL